MSSWIQRAILLPRGPSVISKVFVWRNEMNSFGSKY